MSNCFVAIAGNIGVGKSSLTALLSQRLNWQPLYEAAAENPYLADFYVDMRRWSFHSQIFFLTWRARHHREIVHSPHPVVQDRTIYEDAEVFARNLCEQGHMDRRDYATYVALYEVLSQLLPPPHLLVHLKASVPVLLQRIAWRGRDYERHISSSYLEQLNALYERWVATFTRCPVLTIDTDRLDFVRFTADTEAIVTRIQDRCAALLATGGS
ncbi:MAG: deoxynucleoside kinase [Anaerolineae bacterium]|nr:deoxynucleoside kinase [Anaerolineae bacterium]MDW8070859.1 deoxynucleoside kinase [Anaerolineae bacterium]